MPIVYHKETAMPLILGIGAAVVAGVVLLVRWLKRQTGGGFMGESPAPRKRKR